MAWTTPRTWAANAVLTAAQLNEQVRDNLLYLLNRPYAVQLTNEGSDYTTTSTSFVDVDGTDLSKTVTTYGGDVLVVFSANARHSAVDGKVYFDLTLDGTRVGGDDGLTVYWGTAGNQVSPVTVAYLCTSLAPGSHTFKVQWKTSASTASLFAGAGTSALDVHPFFFVKEV